MNENHSNSKKRLALSMKKRVSLCKTDKQLDDPTELNPQVEPQLNPRSGVQLSWRSTHIHMATLNSSTKDYEKTHRTEIVQDWLVNRSQTNLTND